MKIVISNTVNMPIYEQVVNQIRDAVINGELKAGEGMPSIRVLAKELAVSVIQQSVPTRSWKRKALLSLFPEGDFMYASRKMTI